MMKNRKKLITAVIVLCVAIFLIIHTKTAKDQPKGNSRKVINPIMGSVQLKVATMGVVEPQNRLELKPSISGRIEDILVEEGSEVKSGEILAWERIF